MADNYRNGRGGNRDSKPKPIPTEQPQNLDAEASLLGAILIDADAIVKIADIINPEDFFDARNMHIYEAIVLLYEKRSPIDVLTLSDQLKTNGYIDMIGGPQYLTELTNFVPTAAHVEQYAEIVAQKAMRRRLIHTSSEISQLGYDEARSLKELIEEAETRLFQVSQQHVKQTVVSIEDILAESFERLDELHKDKQKIRGIPTGFKDIDETLAGLQRSDLFILAARPSMGKAQPLDANILTTAGWKKMGDMKIGDSLASVDGQTSMVTGVFPQGIKQIYRVSFSDGRSAETCGEHLWTVHYRGWERPRVLTTDEVAVLLTRKRYQKRLWIEMFDGRYGHHEFLPIAPWVLGMLIGEGDFGSMRFSTASEFVLNRMELELGEAYKLNHAGNFDYRIVQSADNYKRGTPSPLREQLKAFGLWGKRSHEKFIPDIYKHASFHARLSLLQGLLDADGWAEKHRT
jgi:replicative DNA helicase